MAVSAKWFNYGLSYVSNGTIIWKASGGSTIRCALIDDTLAPNQDTHDFWSDLSANEISGTGYTANGEAMTLVDPVLDAATNECRLDANDVSWTSATFSGARYAILYKDTSGELLGWVDFGQDESVTGGTFTIEWASTPDIVLKYTAS